MLKLVKPNQMANPDPGHLLDQATKLIQPPAAGPPRQVDLRRAISSAYYAVFHALLAAAADQVIGKTKRGSAEYGLAYRSLDHRWIKELCADIGKPQPSKKIAGMMPAGGFGPNLQALAVAVVALQERRHEADYNPLLKFKTSDALLAISTARSALRRLARAPVAKRHRMLTLLMFPPR